MKKPSSKKSPTVKPSLLQVIVNALEDLKAQNIVTLDVSRLTDVTDTLIIASGSSSRQVRALAQNAVEDAKKHGMPSIGIEGLDGGEWVLADFGDAVLHVMQPETREFYDLENLWQTRETKAAAAEAKTDAKKSASAKPAATKSTTAPSTVENRAVGKSAFIPEAEFTTQSDAAKARKSPGKPKAAPPKADTKKSVTKAGPVKAAPVKAGVRAKTGTKKPAASKAVSEKTTVKKTVAKKVAAPKSAAAKPKPAAPKLTAKKPAAKKPAARKSPAK